MKRAFPVMAVLFCCMIFCMTGCGSSEKSDSGAKEEKTVKKQEQQNEKEEEKESEKEPEILQFVDVYGQQYSVEINQNIAKKQYNDTLFIHDGDRLTYADEKYTSRLGIDVSYHQGEIDWKKVKAAGYDFAFIRIGYRGYAEAGTVNADIRFDEYIQQAQNAGLDVGVYFFSQAVNEEEAREEEKYDPTEGGIHRYEFIIADVTWSQAFADCKSRGGYLVRINSEEEYQYILKQLDAGSYQKIQFFIGGRRDSGSSEYYWADEDDELYGDQINTSSYWCSSEWLSGEPSFRDGANEEEYLDLLYYKNEGRWTWNDAPNDILAVVPSFSGRIGYICEYED